LYCRLAYIFGLTDVNTLVIRCNAGNTDLNITGLDLTLHVEIPRPSGVANTQQTQGRYYY
jgi:hypothetical protein